MLFLGALFAVGLGFTACSSDKDVADEKSPQAENNGGGKYIAMSINLPVSSAAVTRAATTDNNGTVTYSDGLPAEYAINDATLLIFSSDDKFIEAYDLTNATKPWETGQSNNVTNYSTKVIQPVSGSVTVGSKLLVVLNHNNIFKWITDGDKQVLSSDGSTAIAAETTFATLNKTITTSTADPAEMKGNGFFMTNAPLADKPGSTADPSGAKLVTLVPITQLFETESEAQVGAAHQIFVERGLAKVTVQGSNGYFTTSSIDGHAIKSGEAYTEDALEYTVTGWTLDNLNPQSYVVRNISAEDHTSFLGLVSGKLKSAKGYRYVGNTEIKNGVNVSSGLYRTYFAKSANYDKSTNLLRFADPSHATGETNPLYCFENTFSVDDQDVNKTTLVQLAVTAKPKGATAVNLYTLGGNRQIIYKGDAINTTVKSKAVDYIKNNNLIVSGNISNTDFTFDIETEANRTITDGKVATVKISYNSSSSVKLKGTAFGKTDTEENQATSGDLGDDIAAAILSSCGEIVQYEGGVSYYNIRIKHFGDDLTPWRTWEGIESTDFATWTAPASGAIYPDNSGKTNAATSGQRDMDYLGRYGVLRNNWYDIKVNSIRTLGTATPHSASEPWDDTPDDEVDSYLSFQINVLSWAKRTQGADL